MKQNRVEVQKMIGLSEGGFVNHPKDPGGATDRGITQKTFDAWNVSKGLPRKSVRGISKEIAEQIIYEQYMKPIRFDDLPSGLDYAMADYSVNSGPARAIKELQGIVRVSTDGIFGNITLQAVLSMTTTTKQLQRLIVELCNRRMTYLRALSNWKTFGNGWKARVMGEIDGVQARDTGVIDRAHRMAANLPVSGAVKAFKTPKAPEPEPPQVIEDDPASVGTLVSGAGIVTAAGTLLAPIGSLHPAAQVIAVGGLLVAFAAVIYVMRARLRRMAARL